MRSVIVDASIALKWVVTEEDSDAALALAEREMAAPTLLHVECANALWAKARRKELTPAEVLQRTKALSTAPIEWVPVETLIEEAVGLALKLGHPVYDCLYLALAARRGWQLVTADRRFADAVRRHEDLAPLLILLSEL
jgi:predicted nucleic acid-binding protein